MGTGPVRQMAQEAAVMAHYILVGCPCERVAHGPPWCNGSTPAFGAVEYRFESYGRNRFCRRRVHAGLGGTMELIPIAYVRKSDYGPGRSAT